MSISIHDRLKKNRKRVPYEQWRKDLRRSMIKFVLLSFGGYFAALAFTIWLLWGRTL